MMDEYRFVGSHPDELDGGRPLEPGEFTGPIEIDTSDENTTPKNRQLLEDGFLIKVKAGTGPDPQLREPQASTEVSEGNDENKEG